VSTPVEAARPTKSGFSPAAAFFDLDKTLIARPSTLASGPSIYRHGLLSRADMMRGALAQLRRLAAERGYSLPDCYAYSDSVTDLPLLEIVGHPRAVNPGPRTAPYRHGPGVARALVQWRVRVPGGEPPGNVSGVINQDHQFVPHSIYASRPIRRRKVLRT